MTSSDVERADPSSLNVIEQFKLKRLTKDNIRKTDLFGKRATKTSPSTPSSTPDTRAENAETMKVSEDFSRIYLFSSPWLYFKAVEMAIVLNSLYLSLWLINFITICARVTSSPRWQVVM
jgi:hypothetical protein